MASLVKGDQYCLSSHSETTENKTRIIVKLTDSAQCAIDDFLCNENTQTPTIQFAENGGQVSIPSTQSSDGSARFTFTLSDNQDMQGFECIQQTGPNSLESLGALLYKMQIRANNDVYGATRMAAAKENNKKKSARFIKANGPDIGRKVKVISSERTIPQPNPTIRHRESMSIPTSGSQTSRSKPSAPPPAPSTTSSSTFSSSKKNPPPTKKKTLPKKKNPDLMRKALRERIIHLLALRPYKRPALYYRLNDEGLKDRDRAELTMVLQSVANMKNNEYHLLRHVWNDVQEDWPFYSEQEKETVKRRKPEILKSPILSDESGGSGESPNSTGAGRPSAIRAPPPSSMNLKRPGYFQSADGLLTKKRRISHFRRPEASTTAGSNNNNGNRENARTAGISSSGIGLGNNASVASENNSWENQQQHRQPQHQPQQQQHRERPDFWGERTTSDVLRSGDYGSTKSCLTPTSDSEDINNSGHNNHHNNTTTTTSGNAVSNYSSNGGNNGSGNHHFGSNYHSSNSLSYNDNSTSNHHHSVNGNSGEVAIGGDSNSVASGGSLGHVNFVRSSTGSGETSTNSLGSNGSSNGTAIECKERVDCGSSRASERDAESRENISAGNNSNNGASDNSPNIFGTINSQSSAHNSDSNTENSEYSDLLTSYTTISSFEQRKRYKCDYESKYAEYLKVLREVCRVTEKYEALSAEFKREHAAGNRERSSALQNQLLEEYAQAKNDSAYQETKRRFKYLQKTMGQIRQLVDEYDSKTSADTSASGTAVV